MRIFSAVLVMLGWMVELRAEAPSAVSAPVEKKSQLRKEKLGNVYNVHALGDVYLAGQPTPEDLPLLKAIGVRTVINLRKANEVAWDEAAAVEQLGMKYVHVPFMRAEELQPKVFDEVLKVLRDKKRGVTMFHCGSANRVGAIWYAHRVLDGKLSPAAALKEAQVVGLRTPAYLQKAQEYVELRTKVEAIEVPAER